MYFMINVWRGSVQHDGIRRVGCGSLVGSRRIGRDSSLVCIRRGGRGSLVGGRSRSLGVRRSSNRREPLSGELSRDKRRRMYGLADSKGRSGARGAVAAARGVDAPRTTSFQGSAMRWEGVAVTGAVAVAAGEGALLRSGASAGTVAGGSHENYNEL